MTIRRVAVLISFAIFGAVTAFGQLPAISPAVLTSTGCTAPSTTVSCAALSAAYGPVALSVPTNPPAGTPTWSFGVGTPPPGFTIDPTAGTISGTATSAGEFTFTVTAHYPGQDVTQRYWVYVSSGPLTIQTSTLPGGTVGIPLSTTITATGGVPFVDINNNIYYQWSIVTGSQPDGLGIGGTNGVLSGTPVAAGTFPITLNALDHNGTSVNSPQYSFVVNSTGTPFTITTTSLPNGVISTSYNQTLTQSGGPSSGVTWTILSGTLPAGLGISSNTNGTGAISGTPTATGTSNFTIQASYTSGSSTITASQGLSITINASASTLTMANPAAVSGVVGQTVSMQFTATGGISPYTYSVASGSTLPAGLTLNAQTGRVSGQPTTAGAYTFTIQVTDSSSLQTTATGSMSILGMPNPTSVSGVVGQTLSMQFTASGGTACTTGSSYTYALVAGSLPPGLLLNPQTGLLTGQATQANANPYAFLISATDCSSPALTATATGSITVSVLSISGVTITPNGTVGAATQPTVTLTLGSAPVTAVTGTLSVTFARTFDGQGSREVLFSNGAPTVSFTVAAGSTQATFPAGTVLIVGTAQGFGNLSATFRDALGNNITPQSLQPTIFSIAGTAPVISSFKISLPVGNVYTATVVGYSSTLDMANGVFNFTPSSGTNLADSSVTVSLSSAFTAWYGSSQSNQYGGQFRLTVPFTFSVTGGANSNPIVAATVTLTNAKGSTTSASANPQ